MVADAALDPSVQPIGDTEVLPYAMVILIISNLSSLPSVSEHPFKGLSSTDRQLLEIVQCGIALLWEFVEPEQSASVAAGVASLGTADPSANGS
jgi:hypothetical protein